jgi:hypothetical protein
MIKTKEEIIKQFTELFDRLDHVYAWNIHPFVKDIAENMSKIIGTDCKEELMDIFSRDKENGFSSGFTASMIYIRSDEEVRVARLECVEECYELYLKYNQQEIK